jgi:hypothetical protein
MLLESARSISADAAVTRNPSEFRKSPVIPIHMSTDVQEILWLGT